MRTLVMGILNVTPDSFSDGGRYLDSNLAIKRAEVMIAEGVDIIDIGGESTRPGSERISEAEELDRVLPVLTALAPLGVPLSIDTTRSMVAKRAIEIGVNYVNDVSGGSADSDMYRLIAENPKVQYIVMHSRGPAKTMQDRAQYSDLIREVRTELSERLESAIEAGVDPEQLIIDPGIGFAKSPEHNWELLRNIDRLALLGYPILVGASRKRFLGELIGGGAPDEREAASIAITAAMAKAGIWAVRTHEVRAHREAIATIEAIAGR